MNYQHPAPKHPKGLIAPKAVAALLGISAGTLTVWRSTARYHLPYVKVGRRVMYRPEDVQAFIEHRTLTHTGQGGDA